MAVVDAAGLEARPASAPACWPCCRRWRPRWRRAWRRRPACRRRRTGRDGTPAPGRRPAGFSQTLAVARQPRRAASCAATAPNRSRGQALRHGASSMLDALARGEAFDLAPALAELRETAEDYAIGTSTAAVLAAATERGIPTLRITDEANLFQLGWGCQAKAPAGDHHRRHQFDRGQHRQRQAADQGPARAGRRAGAEAAPPSPRSRKRQRVARRLRGPVTLKPLDGNQGKGVTTACATPDEVGAASPTRANTAAASSSNASSKAATTACWSPADASPPPPGAVRPA